MSSHSKRLSRSWDPLNLPRLKLHCSHKPKGRIDKSLKFPTIRELKKTAPIWFGFFLPGWCRMTNLAWCQVVRKTQVPETRESFKTWTNDWRKSSLKVFFLSLSFSCFSLFLFLLLFLETNNNFCCDENLWHKVLDGGDYPPAPSTPPEPAPPDPRDPRSNTDRRLMQLESVAGFRRLMKASTMPAAASGSHTSLEDITCKKQSLQSGKPPLPPNPHFTVLKNFSRKLCCCLRHSFTNDLVFYVASSLYGLLPAVALQGKSMRRNFSKQTSPVYNPPK